MLDRKTDDFDASVELLEDKQRQAKCYFFAFYIVGACMTIGSNLIPYLHFEIAVMGTGLTLLFVATWIFMGYFQYGFYLFLIHKGVVEAVKEKGNKDKKVNKI